MVAYSFLSHKRAVTRDCARPMCAYECINQSLLGLVAFAGTPFDMNRELAADLLGFDHVMENSMDASATRDFLTETLSALTTHAVTLPGLVADLVILSNKGFVELSGDYSSTSSIILQKKNPDTMGLVRTVVGDAVEELTGLLTMLKGLSHAYNHDLQRAHKHALRAVDDVGGVAAVAAGAVAPTTWLEDELAVAAGVGFSTAIGVADLLAMAGPPFCTIYEVIAEAAARFEGTFDVATLDAIATGVSGKSLFTHVTAEAAEAALDPTENVASCDSVGGPAPAAVEATLSTVRDEPSDDVAAVADVRDSLAAAAKGLDEEVSSYV